MSRRTQTQAATTSALDWDIAEGDDFDILKLTIAIATGPTTGEALTVTLDSHLGAGSDEVLLTVPAADMIGKTEVIIDDIVGMINGDVITVAYTNTDALSITGTAIIEITNRALNKQPVQVGSIDYFLDGVKQGYAKIIGGSDMPLVRQSLTFANDTGTMNVFTVTGDVMLEVIGVTKTNVASAGACNIELGVTGTVAAMIAATDATTLAAGEIWHDTASDSDVEASSVWRSFTVSGGADVILTLSAQLDSGVVAFYCRWRPLSSDGKVVAA